MKKIFLAILLAFPSFFFAQVSLSLQSDVAVTPNSNDTIGVFSRCFYHPGRNKFYVIYAARPAGCALPAGQLTNFAWREYDASFNYTGNSGSLQGYTTAGDYAIVMIDSTYYHLTASPSGPDYILTKYDDDFMSQGNVTITLDLHDSNTDQLMGYGNNRLIIGAFNEPSQVHPTFPMQASWSPSMHLFQFSTSLTPLSPPSYLSPTFYSWGGSALYNTANNHYEVVSMDSFPTYQLYAYEYDQNWNYVSQHLLSTDGQWSQGLVWDGTYYYIAYHSGHEHRSGNVVVAVYDINWTLQDSLTITNYPSYPPPLGVSSNAHRPFIYKLGNMLYVGYDVQTYNYYGGGNYMEHKDWQAHVAKVLVTGIASVHEADKNNSVQVFPDPSQGIFQYSVHDFSANEIKMDVTDVTGKIILHDVVTGQSGTIDLTAQRDGIYFLRIFTGNGIVVKKLVKAE